MARHKSVEAPPIARDVRIERNGTVYEGTYTVNGAAVSVNSPALGSKSAPMGKGSPEIVAKIVLTDLLFAYEERHGGR